MMLPEMTEIKKNDVKKSDVQHHQFNGLTNGLALFFFFLNRLNRQEYVLIQTVFCQKNKTNQ